MKTYADQTDANVSAITQAFDFFCGGVWVAVVFIVLAALFHIVTDI